MKAPHVKLAGTIWVKDAPLLAFCAAQLHVDDGGDDVHDWDGNVDQEDDNNEVVD